jgi:uncharacterized protein YaiE (UPF0345 family)
MGYIGSGPTRFNTADELTVTGDAEITGAITTDGMTTTADITFGDNDKAIFGAGSDLQIYHNGVSASYITDQGTGNLVLGGDSAIILQNSAHNANMLDAYNGGRVGLYHANSLKLATTATGVDVTGAITTDGLTSEAANGTITSKASGASFCSFTANTSAGNNAYVFFQQAGTEMSRITAYNGDVLAFSTGSGAAERMRINSSGNVGINTSSPTLDGSLAGLSVNGSGTVLQVNDDDGATLKLTDPATGANRGLGITLQGTSAAISNCESGELRFGTGNTERMRITSGGSVGIGTTSPNGNAKLTLSGGGLEVPTGYGVFNDTGGANATGINFTAGANVLSFYTGNSERMRIDSSGNLEMAATYGPALRNVSPSATVPSVLVGKTDTDTGLGSPTGDNLSLITGGTERVRIDSSGKTFVTNDSNVSDNNNANFCVNHSASTRGINLHTTGTGGSDRITFQNDNGTVGTINTSGSSTSYATSSDYRLKTAVNYDWDATSRLKQLKPARFEWIVDGDDAVPVDGFLAHEVQDIVPEAISGTHNGMRDEEYEVTPAVLDDDGNEVTPAVMGTRSVPLIIRVLTSLS